MKRLLLLLLAVPAFATVPTITNITVRAVDHASITIETTANAPFYGQLLFGTSSGVYPYSTTSDYNQVVSDSYTGTIVNSLTIGGLTPGTVYYVLSTARPNQGNSTDICNVSGCGAVEQVITTLANPATHPEPPTPPSVWTPTHPNTSGYTVVPLMDNGTTHECVAASNISAQTGWSGGISIGDSIQTIVNNVYYAVAIELPQNANCKVFPTVGDTLQRGTTLPSHGTDTACGGGSQDSSACRWILFRTHQVNASDFPPFGVRTNAALASKYGHFIAQVPNEHALTDVSTVNNYTGQLFDCGASNCNHYWFENIQFDYLDDSSTFPANAIDPHPFGPFVRWQAIDPDVTTLSTTPNYMVLDRIYTPAHSYPARLLNLVVMGGNHWAILNSALYSDFQTIGLWPGSTNPSGFSFPTVSGAVVTIPGPATFQVNSLSGSPCGTSSSATATFSGANIGTYTGVFIGWLSCASGSAALTVDYQTASGVTMTCSGCTATSEATPTTDTSVPVASMYYFSGYFDGSGHAVMQIILNRTNGYLVGISPGPATRFQIWRPIGVYPRSGNFGYMDNNFMQALGQTIYTDPEGPHTDQTLTHNYFYFPRYAMQSNSAWNGYGYTFRNVEEYKIGTRWNITGNFTDGAAAYANAGNAIFMLSSWYAPFSTGVQDFNITNNVFRHIASGPNCAGTGLNYPPDTVQTLRIAITNNLFYDLNRDIYNNGGGGNWSGQIETNPPCGDMAVRNNTFALTSGVWPGVSYVGGANSIPGTEALGEGYAYEHNVATLSTGQTGDVFWSQGGQNVPAFPAVPANANSCIPPVTGGCPTYTDTLNTAFVRMAGSVVPNWSLSSNTIIGAQTNTCAPPSPCYADMTTAQLNAIMANWPGSGNAYPTNSTYAARLAAVNWDPNTYRSNPSSFNSGGSNGADIDALNAAAGIVTGIRVSSRLAGAVFAYTAPDSKACSIDTSTDSGVTWTRTTDSGGARARATLVSGLNATAQYRIMCYFQQTAAQEFKPDQITDGTFTVYSVSH